MLRRDWNLRACAMQGHVHFDPHEAGVRARVRLESSDGPVWRCLRCGGYFAAALQIAGGPVAHAPEVSRGAELRDRFVLRLLASERFIRGVLMLLAGVAVLLFQHAQDGWRQAFFNTLPVLRPIGTRFGIDLDNGSTIRLVEKALTLPGTTLVLVAVALGGYAALQVVEGVGLWLARRWAEYLSVVATSVFLPLEVYEVVDKASALKAATLVLNIAAVVWLVMSKRLFGVRGGHAALIAARREGSVLEPAK